ncbi:hypothetical protein U1Q18_052253 [Sarracenia purpurea var. burkii]
MKRSIRGPKMTHTPEGQVKLPPYAGLYWDNGMAELRYGTTSYGRASLDFHSRNSSADQPAQDVLVEGNTVSDTGKRVQSNAEAMVTASNVQAVHNRVLFGPRLVNKATSGIIVHKNGPWSPEQRYVRLRVATFMGAYRENLHHRSRIAAALYPGRFCTAAADRVIHGTRYVVFANQDSGMSQSITATDLRSVVDGVCYAVARIRYTASAGDSDPSVTMKQADGVTLLDASLASLKVGVGG